MDQGVLSDAMKGRPDRNRYRVNVGHRLLVSDAEFRLVGKFHIVLLFTTNDVHQGYYVKANIGNNESERCSIHGRDDVPKV